MRGKRRDRNRFLNAFKFSFSKASEVVVDRTMAESQGVYFVYKCITLIFRITPNSTEAVLPGTQSVR